MSASLSVTSTSDWIHGISLSVLASIFGAASKLAIRKSFLFEEAWSLLLDPNMTSTTSKADDNTTFRIARHTQHRQRIVVTLSLRLSGMFGMTFLNPLCGVLAMNYASPSIVAPFSGLDLVWVILLSSTFVGEDPTLLQIVAASLIIAGEVIVAIFGDHTNDQTGISLQDLEESYLDPAFLTYLVGFALWMVLIFRWMNHSHAPSRQRFAWGVAGGSVTGLQNFVKDLLTLLKSGNIVNHRHHHEDNEGFSFLWWRWWFCVGSLALLSMTTAVVGLLLLTACMKRYNATFSSAMFVGSFVLNSSIMSAIHYHTFSNLSSTMDLLLYPVGLAILMGGVGILLFVNDNESDESHCQDSDEQLLLSDDNVLLCRSRAPKINAQSKDDDDKSQDRCTRTCHHLGLSLLIQEMRGYEPVEEIEDSDRPIVNSQYGACG
jgi:drug/metabolite transporter (DMT)-like permease